MNIPEADGPLLPVVIVDASGNTLGLAITNTKGYKKSIEQNQAWLVDALSGRLLPAGHIVGFSGITSTTDHYVITATSLNKHEADNAVKSSNSSSEVDVRAGSSAPGDASVKFGDASGKSGDASASVSKLGGILAQLEELLKERRKAMPEGSYTTHLFTQGEEKIRKKTGEEAVELILARDNDELASEGADLIYHMMVLFEARGMSLSDSLAVLEERHK